MRGPGAVAMMALLFVDVVVVVVITRGVRNNGNVMKTIMLIYSTTRFAPRVNMREKWQRRTAGGNFLVIVARVGYARERMRDGERESERERERN